LWPGDPWQPGNLILLLVPVSAARGTISTRRDRLPSTGKSRNMVILVVVTIALSLFVGTRQNPSGVSAEFGILSLAFATWWLSILLARIDQAFKLFIGGRAHLDALSTMWKVTSKVVPFRSIGPAGGTDCVPLTRGSSASQCRDQRPADSQRSH